MDEDRDVKGRQEEGVTPHYEHVRSVYENFHIVAVIHFFLVLLVVLDYIFYGLVVGAFVLAKVVAKDRHARQDI